MRHTDTAPTGGQGASDEDAYDVLGVGFGPAGLALAVALREHPWKDAKAAFLERRPRFGWHPGMLIEDATMQVSFLKDLATLRNPVSPYGFLSYLHERGRLVSFVNQKDFFPTRLEYHDYLEWAAAKFSDLVTYGTEVVGATPVRDGDEVRALDVTAREVATGRTTTLRTRNLVVATGLVPRMPAGITATDRIWHSSELLHRLAALDGREPGRFAVVGAGQSAAEAVAHVHSRFPGAEVTGVIPRYGYSPADDSPFANQVFDPDAVDEFYDSPPGVKEQFYAYHANTNYAVVDLDLINDLYRRMYRESVRGRRRLTMLPMSRVTEATETRDGVLLRVTRAMADRTEELAVDVAVFATGYGPMDAAAALGPAADLCERTGSGALRVARDHRVETGPRVRAGIYVQGGTEHTHGISASLLSNIAGRAWEITESIAAGRRLPASR
ncbi:lysine N(6)-hydroxylase/L-ornithine N(5)-oxygenase family protein [Streptomyces huiliensis]|uniref:lysine N(6)-hydroxylase/L-ornithine N(5)-oxygenase family protein n=1 Tax=Streptomyces huiliensis TaxID=2876027 RepID=UPI001CBCD227|nr:SidA/IucD/PvdA family monooxygenase [Streptomyces huiliensis]MBZ4321257.1 lysine N(6)-hydroxylase/L-ornithine N(5)-oxygenase family protein [Streptomyces huiliensis]